MENIFIAIVTDNREYGRALSLAMLSICRSFIIKINDENEFFQEDKRYDLVLWDSKNKRMEYCENIVFLADKPSEAVKDFDKKYFSLYKYCPADCIVTSLFEIYEAITGRHAVNLKRQNVRMFTFVSCEGGCGCSTVAMSFAQELCRFQGKRVLYLSFEEIESTGKFIKCHSGIKGVGVYLYNLFKEFNIKANPNDNTAYPFLEAYMIKDDFGIEAFAPTYGKNPLRDLDSDELNVFMASLIDSGRFDVIVIDVGTCLSKAGIDCIDMAEKLCFINSGEEESIREEQYITYLMHRCGEDIIKKIVKVCNLNEKTKEKVDDADLYISRYNNMTIEGSVKKLLLEGSFGHEINRLALKLTEA